MVQAPTSDTTKKGRDRKGNFRPAAASNGPSLPHPRARGGNQAVLRMLAQPGFALGISRLATRGLQAKLAINQPHDEFEVEADHVAQSVMRMADPSTQAPIQNGPCLSVQHQQVQRTCSCGEAGGECETCAEKRDMVHRAATGPMQTQGAPPIVDEVLNSPGHALDRSTRAFFEPRFGHDFSQVRVHTGEHAVRSAQAVHARAYTVGRNVVFGSNEYAPHTPSGQLLLAHELTHVVQQDRGATARAEGGLNVASSAPQVQRAPAPQCPNGQKNVSVDLVSLNGSSRDAPGDLDFAQNVFKPCCVNIQMASGRSATATLTSQWLGGDTIMNRATTKGAIDPEQTAVYDGATGAFGLSGRIRAFYVQDMNPSVALATSFPAVWATGAAAPYTGMVVVTNGAASRSLAHEIGHILLNADGAVHTSHPGGTSNLMEPTATATGESLDATQCATIFANS